MRLSEQQRLEFIRRPAEKGGVMRGKIVPLIMSCLIVAALLASCAPPETPKPTPAPTVPKPAPTPTPIPAPAPAVGPKYGGTLVPVLFQQMLSSPNLVQVGTFISYASSYVYERLGVGDWAKGPAGTNEISWIHYTYTPYVRGALAESWEMPDPLTYIFHLRKGVRFHDKPPVSGREVTADDVVYSFQRLVKHTEIAFEARDKIKSARAVDKYTVEFKANKIDSELMGELQLANWVHPREMVEKYGETSADVNAVCGTGPFIMTDFVSGSAVTYKKNPNYWGRDELHPGNQLPYIDTVKFLMILDISTRLAAIRTGKVDYLQRLSPVDAESLKQTSPQLKWAKELNEIATPKFNFRMDKEPFKDRKVRLALAMAIDRNAIVKDYLKGEGFAFSYPFLATWKEVYTPLEELPASTREQFEYNPEKAKKLLAEAGYPKGFKTEIIADVLYVERVQIFQAYWAAIGVDCKINVVDKATWNNLTYGKTYPQMSAGTAGSVSSYGVMNYKRTGHYYNYEMYSDPAVDKKLDEILATFDETKKNKMLKDLQVYYLDAVSMIAFPADNLYAFWQPWVKNYHGEQCLGRLNYGGVAARVWIDQELKKAMGH